MQYTVMESEGGGPGEWMAPRWESHVSGGKRANVIDRSSRSLSILYHLSPSASASETSKGNNAIIITYLTPNTNAIIGGRTEMTKKVVTRAPNRSDLFSIFR